MNLERPQKLHNRQAGFSLLEVVLALAIAGIIAAGVMTTLSQVFVVNAASGSRMAAVKQVEYAVDRMRTDVQMAQTFIPGPDSGIPLVLSWKEWDGSEIEVTYYLTGNDLKRGISTGGSLPVESTIALNIQSVSASSVPSENSSKKLSITITAFVDGLRSATESRTFEILCRPGT